jgi:amidase
MPIGSQFMAPFGQEHVLLALAAELEQAQPWKARYRHIEV